MTTKPKARKYRIYSNSQSNDLSFPDHGDGAAAAGPVATPAPTPKQEASSAPAQAPAAKMAAMAQAAAQDGPTTPQAISDSGQHGHVKTNEQPKPQPQGHPKEQATGPLATPNEDPAVKDDATREAEQREQLAQHAAASRAMRNARAAQAEAGAAGPDAEAGKKAAPAPGADKDDEAAGHGARDTAAQPPAAAAQERSNEGTGADAGSDAGTGQVPDTSGAVPSGTAEEEESPAAIEAALEEIRREGLTGRQLRMARRIALKNGMQPSSDFEAVRQLRARGIDPFQPGNLPQPTPGGIPATVPADDGKLPQTAPGGTPPATSPSASPPPGPSKGQKGPGGAMTPSERRQREIMDIQRDISRRRRRRTVQLFARLAFFVLLPTLLAGWYYYRVATPMYSTDSEFLILQADATAATPLGGLLSGTQFATNQDSIAVQSYLQSKDAMLRLDQDVGFKSEFSQPSIDPIQRLPENPTNEEAYKAYQKYVQIGYDPTEGVIQMEVVAPDPDVATEYSNHLIMYAEERIDELSRRKREDAVSAARDSLEQAKRERREAQERLVSLQEGTVVDPEGVIGTMRSQISTVEMQLNEKELELAALQDNVRPNAARVAGVQADIDRLNALLASLNSRMNNAQVDDVSLAEKTAQIQMAQADVATADMFLQSALQNEKQTELEANRQVRYLTTSVRPVPSQDPSYPKAFENTMLVFLIMSGIYLMVSLTGAILREQVSN